MSETAKGWLIATIAILVLLPDTILFRMVETSPWVILFWRAGFTGLMLWIGLAVTYRSKLPALVRDMGRGGVYYTLSMGLSMTCFVAALAWTSVANTLLIISTAPLWAAILSWVFLGERVGVRTGGAIAVAICAIAYIASGEEGGVVSIEGNIAALGGAIGMAAAFTLARHLKDRNLTPGIAIAPIVPMTLTLTLHGFALPDSIRDAALIFAMGGLIAPIAWTLLTFASRFLPSPQISFILLLETVLAPFLVWWIIGEHPGERALIGGTVVVAALVFANIRSLKRSR